MKKFPHFVQTTTSAWLWLALFFINFAQGILALASGRWANFFDAVFLCGLIYWVDQLEKEISRRNKGKLDE